MPEASRSAAIMPMIGGRLGRDVSSGFASAPCARQSGSCMQLHRGRALRSLVALAALAAVQSVQDLQDAIPPPSHITLRYFGIRGLAESVRLTLSECGMPFENVHVAREAWYSKLKAEGTESGALPFAQLPQLEVEQPISSDGTHRRIVLVQSGAILRFLGRHCGLLPDEAPALPQFGWSAGQLDKAEERARIEMALGGIGDIRSRYGKLCYNKEALRPESGLLKHYAEVELPKWFGHFERWLERADAGSGSGWLSHGNFSIADIALFDSVEQNLRLAPKAIKGMPRLQAFQRRVAARPGIKRWIEDGRRTPHCNGAPAASLDTQEHQPACTGNGAECLPKAHRLGLQDEL